MSAGSNMEITMKKLSYLSASVAAAIFISGCSSSHSPKVQESLERVTKKVEGGFQEQIKELEMERGGIGKLVRGPAYHDVNDYSLIEKDERKLPTAFNSAAFITDANDSYTLDEFSALIYSSYGIILDVSSSDLDQLSNQGDNKEQPQLNESTARNQGVFSDSASDYDAVVDLIGNSNTVASRDELTLKPFKFEGSVKELLDYVAILNGLKWKYDNEFKKAYMYVYETRDFQIFELGDNIQESTTITTTTSQEADSTSGGSQKQLSRSSSTNTWDEIMASVNSMLTQSAGRASFDKKSGLVVVTDNDYVLSRVNNYINKLNNIATKEVVIQYRIIRFKYDESTNKGINQNYLNGQLKSNMLGNFDLEIGSGQLSPSLTGNLGAFQEIVGGNFLSIANGSHQLLMGFLNNVGSAELAYQNQVPILNNDVYSHQGGTNQEFISSIERSAISTGVGQENITTEKDVAVDGVNMTLKPRIFGDEIIVKYSISNSDFIGLTDAGLGAGLEGVQLKTDSSLDISHTAKFQNGIPRVIQFIHESDDTADSNGMFDHAFWMLGGSESRNESKNAVIVTMTVSYNN